MRTVRLKHGIAIIGKQDRGVKLEWGNLGWLGFAFRRDLRGFTLNFFVFFNLHISFAYSQGSADREVKTYGGFIMLREMLAVWQWAWTGGGSEISKPGTFKQWNYGDALLGAPAFSSHDRPAVEHKLEMPEASYGLLVTVGVGEWKRPRSPFTKRLYRARIQVADDREIPVPTDADGGESGTYGETRNGLKTGNVAKIVDDYKFDLMEERKFVGGSYDWKPKS